MDNLTYAGVTVMPSNNENDNTYSRLSTTQQFSASGTKAQINQSEPNGDKNSQLRFSYSRKLAVAVMLVVTILLTTCVVSIVLSVATYSRLVSYISDDNTRLDKIIQGFSSAKSQFSTADSNMSRMLTQLDAKISDFISVQTQNENLRTQLYCGPGLWCRVAYLNMSDPKEHCPPTWMEYNTSGIRACGRPDNSRGSCIATVHSTNFQYSRVCGRVIGYQMASPDAFSANNDIDLDGIDITHGVQHVHIWSYVAGQSASQQSRDRQSNCPCNGPGQGRQPPLSINGDFYCESGNQDERFQYKLYTNDKLWDGHECEGTCCTGTKSPPWFSVQLPAPTNDSIEVRICCDQGTEDEDTPIELLELYVQ